MPDLEDIKRLFDQALTLPPGEARRAWIVARRGESPEVRDEVLSLVAFFEQAAQVSSDALAKAVPIPSGRFGPYRAVEFVGRGGTSAVFRAERADQTIHPPTALKVMAAFMSGPEFSSRFETEWRLLASLNHPHIARLIEGGLSSAGEPFLAMEFVEGERFDRYADRRRLSLEDRLELLLQVCEAVEYAHHRMIVHRDLKPDNILVTKDAKIKLLDFGTASLLDADRDITRTRSRMLTPRYASPERLRGEPASVADDVYSLGVILYESLTGASPFGEAQSPLTELERAVGDRAPANPAAVVADAAAERRQLDRRGLQRALKGDLTAIVLKAIEQDPARRYSTVRDLSDDLGRALASRPVQARPPTFGYRSAKFLRRHWLASSLTVLVAAGLAAAVAVALNQARLARAEAMKASAANQFLSQILSTFGASDFDGSTFTVADMLGAAEARLETGPKLDPVVEAMTRRSLAQSYLGLARLDDAQRELDRALPMLSQSGDSAEIARGWLTQSNLDMAQGRYQAAVDHAGLALRTLEQQGRQAAASDIFEAKVMMAQALSPAALNGDAGKRRGLIEDAIRLADQDHSIPRTRAATAMSVLGGLLLNEGKTKEGEALEWQSLETGRVEEPGGSWEVEPLYLLATAKEREGDVVNARDLTSRQLAVMTRHAGEDHPSTATARVRWARLAARTGQVADADAAVRRAMTIIEKRLSPTSPDFWLATRDAAVVMRLAGHPQDAERYARASLTAAEAQHLSDDDPRLANSWDQLGQAESANGKSADAIRSLERAEAIYQRAGPVWASSAARERTLIQGIGKPGR